MLMFESEVSWDGYHIGPSLADPFRSSTNISLTSASCRRKHLDGAKMSRRNGNAPKLDLKLNLSPPRVNRGRVSSSYPSRSATASPISPPSSCVSSEANNGEDTSLRYSNSPEATSMVLAGCPRCLMYVMLSEEDPKCPKCKSPVMLDFLRENSSGNNNKGGGNNSGRRNKRSYGQLQRRRAIIFKCCLKKGSAIFASF